MNTYHRNTNKFFNNIFRMLTFFMKIPLLGRKYKVRAYCRAHFKYICAFFKAYKCINASMLLYMECAITKNNIQRKHFLNRKMAFSSLFLKIKIDVVNLPTWKEGVSFCIFFGTGYLENLLRN